MRGKMKGKKRGLDSSTDVDLELFEELFGIMDDDIKGIYEEESESIEAIDLLSVEEYNKKMLYTEDKSKGIEKLMSDIPVSDKIIYSETYIRYLLSKGVTNIDSYIESEWGVISEYSLGNEDSRVKYNKVLNIITDGIKIHESEILDEQLTKRGIRLGIADYNGILKSLKYEVVLKEEGSLALMVNIVSDYKGYGRVKLGEVEVTGEGVINELDDGKILTNLKGYVRINNIEKLYLYKEEEEYKGAKGCNAFLYAKAIQGEPYSSVLNVEEGSNSDWVLGVETHIGMYLMGKVEDIESKRIKI